MMRRLGLLRLLIAWIPALLVIGWGITYIRSVVLTALSPGAPIEINYPTPGGVLSISASSYSVVLSQGVALLTMPRIVDPAGRVLASADRVQVRFPPGNIATGPYRVIAYNAFGRLEREKSGKFQIQSFFPKKSAIVSQTAFNVDVRGMNAIFIDDTYPKPFVQAVSAPDLKFEGSQGSWVSSSMLTLANIGKVAVRATRIQDVLDGSFQTAGINVPQQILHYIDFLPLSSQQYMANASFAHLFVAGSGEIELPAQGNFKIRSALDVDATQPRYDKWDADSATGHVNLTELGLNEDFLVKRAGVMAKSVGSMSWTSGNPLIQTAVSGSVVDLASALQAAHVTLPKLLAGKNLEALGTQFSGDAYFDEKNGIRISGRIITNKVQIQGQEANQVQGTFDYANGAVSFNASGNHTSLGPVSAAGRYQISQNALQAHVDLPLLGMSRLQAIIGLNNAKRYGQISGTVNSSANVQMKNDVITADFRAEGNGQYLEPQFQDRRVSPVGISGLAVLGTFQNNVAVINRLWLKTDSGTAWASGRVNIASKQLLASIHTRGIDLSQLVAQTSGLVVTDGNITGSYVNPKFQGIVEVYNPQYQNQELSLIRANAAANLDKVALTNVQILKGTSFASGDVALNLHSQALSGNFESKGISVADVLGPNYDGIVSASIPEISGTLANPQLQVSVTGSNLIANKIPISSVNARAQLNHHQIILTAGNASAVGGYLTLSGNYDLDRNRGKASATLKDLNLDKLVPILAQEKKLDLDGIANGNAEASFSSSGLTSLNSSGTLESVVFNAVPAGNGVWDVTSDGKDFKGSVQVFQQEKFLALENADYNVSSHNLTGDVVVSGLPAEDLVASVAPFLKQTNRATLEDLRDARGTLQFATSFDTNTQESLKQSSFKVDSASIQGFQYKGVSFGNLDGSFSYANESVDISALTYQDGAGIGKITGTYDPNTTAALDADFSNIDLSKFAAIIPNFPKIAGLGSLTAVVSGKSSDPNLRASVDIENFKTGLIPSQFALTLNEIDASNGNLSIGGNLTYNGFVSQIVGNFPYDLDAGILVDKPVNAKLTLLPRSLKEVAQFSAFIDPNRAVGTLNASINLGGTLNQPTVLGNVDLVASELGFRQQIGVDKQKPAYLYYGTEIKNLNLKGSLNDDTLQASVTGDSSKGGTFSGTSQVQFKQLSYYLQHPFELTLDSFLSTALQASVQFNQFDASENNKIFTTSLALSGKVNVAGDLKSPAVTGNLTVANLNTTIPALQAQTGTASIPIIDPTFNLRATLSNPATIRTSLASITLTGGGNVQGSLASPDVQANLNVAGGSLRLPGGNVRLVKGGSVVGTYAPDTTGALVAKLEVDLTAQTHVTASPTVGTLNRYDVSLEVTGDLLAPDQVQFSASSDPPDLSQNQILALLGRTDILTALGSNQSYGQTQQALTGVFAGYALPSLLEPITKNLAAGLGLDYLNVEYNQFSQASIVIGKLLGKGLSFFAAQQISEPLPGFPRYYDYHLEYRPPGLKGSLSRLSFILGQDQYSRYKIGIQYSTRF